MDTDMRARADRAFSVGARVLVQDRSDPEEIVNAVGRLEARGRDRWVVTLLDELAESFVLDAPVRLTTPGEGALFVADSVVAERAGWVLTLVPPAELSYVQRRVHRRIEVTLNAVWRTGSASGTGTVVDLSRSGLRLSGMPFVRVGEHVSLEVAAAGGVAPLSGLVVAMTPGEDGLYAHVAFTAISDAQRADIETLLDAVLDDAA